MSRTTEWDENEMQYEERNLMRRDINIHAVKFLSVCNICERKTNVWKNYIKVVDRRKHLLLLDGCKLQCGIKKKYLHTHFWSFLQMRHVMRLFMSPYSPIRGKCAIVCALVAKKLCAHGKSSWRGNLSLFTR